MLYLLSFCVNSREKKLIKIATPKTKEIKTFCGEADMNKKKKKPSVFFQGERVKKYIIVVFFIYPNKKNKKIVTLGLDAPIIRKTKMLIAELEILKLVKETIIYTKDPQDLDTISKEEMHHVNQVFLQATKRKLKV